MTYISNFLPQNLNPFAPVILDPKERAEHYDKIIKDKIKKSKEKDIEFRNSSDIKMQKKPCPCMANKIKQTPFS